VIRYAITGDNYSLGAAERWTDDGVDLVQLRAKTMDAGALTLLAKKILSEIGGKTRLLVNGRVDVAIASGAAGVHLTAHPEELTPTQVRQIFASAGAATPAISVSCHTLADVERARDAGVDLILFGPVFEKRVGDDVIIANGVGLEMLRRACEIAAPTKVLALGGVTATNISPCTNAGAAGVAGIRLFG
jgi:thiamine-phosphate pyrophosphorylase